MKYPKQFALMILLMVLTANANAILIGENIQGQLNNFYDQTQIVTDPGLEFSVTGGGGATAQADLFGTSLSLIFNSAGISSIGLDFLWSFTLINSDLIFTSVLETADNYINGASFSGISNGGKTISFIILDQNQPLNTTYVANYNVGVWDTSSSIPEPTTLVLLGLGLVGLGYQCRKSVA